MSIEAASERKKRKSMEAAAASANGGEMSQELSFAEV